MSFVLCIISWGPHIKQGKYHKVLDGWLLSRWRGILCRQCISLFSFFLLLINIKLVATMVFKTILHIPKEWTCCMDLCWNKHGPWLQFQSELLPFLFSTLLHTCTSSLKKKSFIKAYLDVLIFVHPLHYIIKHISGNRDGT